MSHFTTLVVTKDAPIEAVLEAALLPFHEYECTGIEAYLCHNCMHEAVARIQGALIPAKHRP